MASSVPEWFGEYPLHTTAASSSSQSATRRADVPTDLALYSVENFEPRPPQELVCTVCRGVYRDPVECPCRHVFCSICIQGWLAHSASPGTGSCPLCRREVSLSQVVPVVPLINNMIAHLTLRCPNREAGCPAKMTLESVNHHMEACEFNRVLCPDCGAQMRSSELPSHQLEQCPKRLVRCNRGCCFSLLAEQQRDHNCLREMRGYITSLEQTREMLRHQIDHTQQCLSRLQRQVRELAVRVEACAVRVRELGAGAPRGPREHMRTERPPKNSRLAMYQWQLTKESGLAWRPICGSCSSNGDTPSPRLRRQIAVPEPGRPSWDVPIEPEASAGEPKQDDAAEQCAAAFKLFPNDGRTATLFHNTDGSCCHPSCKMPMQAEPSGPDGGAFIAPAAPFSTENSTHHTAAQSQYRFTFNVEPTYDQSMAPSMSALRMPHTLQSTTTRLSVPTVSEMMAAATPVPVSSSVPFNATPEGMHDSSSVMGVVNELTSELHLDTTFSGSNVAGAWYPPPTDQFLMQQGLAPNLRTALHPEQGTPRNVDDTGMEYAPLSDGGPDGSHLSRLIRRAWVSGRPPNGGNLDPTE